MSKRSRELADRLIATYWKLQEAANICRSWEAVAPYPSVRVQSMRAALQCKRYERAFMRASRLP